MARSPARSTLLLPRAATTRIVTGKLAATSHYHDGHRPGPPGQRQAWNRAAMTATLAALLGGMALGALDDALATWWAWAAHSLANSAGACVLACFLVAWFAKTPAGLPPEAWLASSAWSQASTSSRRCTPHRHPTGCSRSGSCWLPSSDHSSGWRPEQLAAAGPDGRQLPPSRSVPSSRWTLCSREPALFSPPAGEAEQPSTGTSKRPLASDCRSPCSWFAATSEAESQRGYGFQEGPGCRPPCVAACVTQ